jgi:hypothetical protein
VLLRDPLERIFSFFLSLSAIPRELIQHSDFQDARAVQLLSSGGSLEHGLRTDHRDPAREQALHQERVHLDVAVGTAWVYMPYSMQVQKRDLHRPRQEARED